MSGRRSCSWGWRFKHHLPSLEDGQGEIDSDPAAKIGHRLADVRKQSHHSDMVGVLGNNLVREEVTQVNRGAVLSDKHRSQIRGRKVRGQVESDPKIARLIVGGTLAAADR